MNMIYCWIDAWVGSDAVVCSVSEDGVLLAQHISSDVAWAKSDIGVTSERKHEIYRAHYPNGFELEWVDNPLEHSGMRQAASRAKQSLTAEESGTAPDRLR